MFLIYFENPHFILLYLFVAYIHLQEVIRIYIFNRYYIHLWRSDSHRIKYPSLRLGWKKVTLLWHVWCRFAKWTMRVAVRSSPWLVNAVVILRNLIVSPVSNKSVSSMPWWKCLRRSVVYLSNFKNLFSEFQRLKYASLTHD